MKNREQESLLKSFALFFLSMQLLTGIIAYLFYQGEVSNRNDALFLEMQNYSLTLQGDKFSIDIVSKEAATQNYTLYEKEGLYALFPIPGVEDTLLKVTYSKEALQKERSSIAVTIWIYMAVITVGLVGLALLFTRYTLRPIRQSMALLEEFLKDMIHDLNTPVTSILVNSRLLKKNFKPQRIERIELAAKTIGSLHRNLESFLRDTPMQVTTINMKRLLQERIDYFASLYDNLSFTSQLEPVTLHTSEDALRRIIDNLLSNACKYNRSNGSVAVTLSEEGFEVKDSGIGIREPAKVFERFYKEGERGLGIGLHIVKKLTDELGMKIGVTSSSEGSVFSVKWR